MIFEVSCHATLNSNIFIRLYQITFVSNKRTTSFPNLKFYLLLQIDQTRDNIVRIPLRDSGFFRFKKKDKIFESFVRQTYLAIYRIKFPVRRNVSESFQRYALIFSTDCSTCWALQNLLRRAN